MPILKTPRAQRNNPFYMDQLINNMVNARNIVFKKGYGIIGDQVESIICSFRMVSNAYQKMNKFEVHYMELIVEMDKELNDVKAVADQMGNYFFDQRFQSFITVIAERDFYLIAIVVNSVAFIEGPLFHDNNYNYMMILEFLKRITPYDWNVKASSCTFFDSKVGEGNYVHGYYR